MIITACTIQAPYSKTVANVLKTLLIISIINSKIINNSLTTNAQMAKLVDASDLNSDDYYNRAGSIPALSTFINLKTIIMRAKKSIRAWVAREKNGALFLFREKPKKRKSYWINLNTFNSLLLPKEAFPNVKWEDNEPTRVYIRIA